MIFYISQDALALSIEMLRKIWKPDTYGEDIIPVKCRCNILLFKTYFICPNPLNND